MTRMLVLAVAAPLVLIGAAYPDAPEAGGGGDSILAPRMGPVSYRPCRPGRGDDRCIQLYERGVPAAYARWQRERRGGEQIALAAVGAPSEAPAHRPRRRHAEAATPHHAGDARCHEPAAHAPAPREAPAQHGEARGM